jgi:hypothetical protein
MASIVQTKTNGDGISQVVFDAPTVAGKVLFCYETQRDGVTDDGGSGWTALSADVSTNGAADGDHGRWWYRASTATATYPTASSRNFVYETDIDSATFVPGTDVTLYESDNAGTSATLGLGAVTAPTSSQLILYGATYDTGFGGAVPATPGTGWTLDYNADKDGSSPPAGAADQHPHTLVMRWDGSTTPLTGSAAIGSAYPYAGVMIQTAASPLATCDSPVAFDVYSLGTATTPALTYLATLCDAFDKSFRVEKDGTGSGKFSINRSSSDATAAILGDGDGDVRYVQVRIPGITGWDEARFGFFIEEGDFRLLDSAEQGGETLTFTGHGSLAYLGFAVMGTHSYITGGMDPYTGLWRLYQAGTGSKPGQMLGRIIEEAQDGDRPQVPLPLLTDTFDYTNDSNAAAWASSTATDEFSAQIGESLLSVAGRLIGTGAITIQMSPTFVLSAYNSFGTDRSSATFAAGKVRFVGGTNIAEGLTRQIRPSRVATHEWVYGESEASTVSSLADAASRVTREAFITTTGSITATLDAVGDADLAERQLRSESLSVRIALGDDEGTGLYLPWDHFWVGDTITLDTGTGEFDYDDVAFKVAAINVIEGPAAKEVTDLEVRVELGSTQMLDAAGSSSGGATSTTISASPGGGSSAVPFHTHPSSSIVSAWKEPVRAASTGNLTISGPGATIDGVTMALQDRFLAKDQTAGAENGIYVWLGAAVAAVRAPDFSTGSQAVGAAVMVSEGTANADTTWQCTTNATITLDTTALVFAELSGTANAELNIEGGQSVISAHGAMGATETFDPTAGNVHSGTLSADLTATISAPVGTGASTLEFWLTQDGTGGWDITWPGSVTWDGGTPTPDTTAGVTVRYILESIDGGTNWIGNLVGAGGSTSPLTTKGDLWGYDTADARVPVGTNGYVLTADSTDAQGVTWAAPAAATTYYEVLLTEDGSEPITTEDGLDWIYVEVSI